MVEQKSSSGGLTLSHDLAKETGDTCESPIRPKVQLANGTVAKAFGA